MSGKGDPPPYVEKAPGVKAVRPTSFVSIVHKSGSIKGQYAIDPAIKSRLPLPDKEPASDRSNLKAVTGDGDIDLTISLAYGKLGRENKRERATLLVRAEDVSKTQTVVRVNREVSILIPFILNVVSKNGDIIVHIPRSFTGLLSITGSEKIHISDSVQDNVGNWNETDTSRQCFIGDLTELDDQTVGADAWNGDEVILETEKGSITVQHVDTDPGPESVSGLPPAVPPTTRQPNVFFELTAGGKSLGRFVCELDDDKMPLTAMLFRKLAKTVDGSGFQGKEMEFSGDEWVYNESVHWGSESRSVGPGEYPGRGDLYRVISGTGYEYHLWWLTLSEKPYSKHGTFGKVVSGLDVLLGSQRWARAVISQCGLVV